MFLVVPHSAALELRPDLAKLQLPGSAKTDGFRTDMGPEKGISLGSFRRRAADFSCVDCTCLRPSDAYIVVSVLGCPAIAAIRRELRLRVTYGRREKVCPFPPRPAQGVSFVTFPFEPQIAFDCVLMRLHT